MVGSPAPNMGGTIILGRAGRDSPGREGVRGVDSGRPGKGGREAGSAILLVSDPMLSVGGPLV